MTITRIGQLTGETRVMTNVSYLAAGVAPTISSAQAKTGTYSYLVGFGKGAMGLAVSSLTALRLSYWLYTSTTDIDDVALIYFAGASNAIDNSQFHIYITPNQSSGNLNIRRPLGNGTWETLASTPIPAQFATSGTWFHIGITHKIDATAGFLSVYIDGVQVLNLVGDTRPSRWTGSAQAFATTTAFVLGAGAQSSSGSQGFQTAYIDDLFVDSIVGETDTVVPARRFGVIFPTGVGEDNAWTPQGSANNWENVDDNPHDGDSSYNKALAVDLRDTFVFGDFTVPDDHQIVAIIPSPFAKRLDSEIDHLLSVHAWDGVQYGDSDDISMSMSYSSPIFGRLTLQPDGAQWSQADLNAMEFGYRSRGSF